MSDLRWMSAGELTASIRRGELSLPEAPGLGIELDEAVIAEHPYRPLAFPSLWDSTWVDEFTGTARLARIR